ncbi:hypothetical protein MKW98_009139 [Papaver atlanticum]|uniref:Late embryogenesis abundant protein LEA-2 subgroup domain-containing protein n=1 Tax=Papaver atlanticum TaxID=357466 RepID=A0AAD4T988_9MAGN|nr:hypothetical protein MKW98_009139 [Papaver atlanticum]
MVLFVASPFGHPTTEPEYAIDSISIKGINLTSPESLTLSPEFDISISYGNRDENMGLYYYEKGSFISISYSNFLLCSSGEIMPNFHQPKNNITVLGMVLKCSGVKITTTVHDSLLRDQRQGKIRFAIDMKIPIRADTGAVEVTARSILKVFCVIKVNGLAMDSEIISQKQCVLVNKIWRSNYKNKGSEDSENKLAKASS